MDELRVLREQLDQLDLQIAALLNERMKTVDQIGRIKSDLEIALIDKKREEEVINQVRQEVDHPILRQTIGNIYHTIIEESRIAQKFMQHRSCPFRRIGIIGLGLMGGSICKAIKIKNTNISISTLAYEGENHTEAILDGWLNREFKTMSELMKNVDLLILAAPISSIIPIAQEIALHRSDLSQKLIVIDIASVKREIVNVFEHLTDQKLEFIGTHPMAGKEKKGFENSQGTLFVDAPWIVVPHIKNRLETINQVQEWIRFMGSEPVSIDAEAHDEQTALISHIPGIISQNFFEFVKNVKPESLKIAGPGWRSFTRLAHDTSEMRKEIAKSNKDIIGRYINLWQENLKSKEVKSS